MPHGKGPRRTDLARGSAALVGVVALAAGVPVALTSAVGSPLPALRPRFDAVTRAVGDGFVSDTILVKTVAAVGWLVWFELVALLAVEATAYARGRRPAGVPLAGALQPAAARSFPVHVVRRRDTLWDIAERHLGDPFRWREILELNRGRSQHGGGRLTDPEAIVAGWRLDLSADATGLPPTGLPPAGGHGAARPDEQGA